MRPEGGRLIPHTVCTYIMAEHATEKRTQVYLTAAQHRAAAALGRRTGRSLAGVVRDALDRHLAADDAGIDWADDPLLALVGALELPPAREPLDAEIDRVVYEDEVAEWCSSTARGSSPPSTRVRAAPDHRAGLGRDRHLPAPARRLAVARQVGETMLRSRVLEIVGIDAEALAAAWREFLRSGQPGLSLCDAHAFVVMRERGVTRALTFDDGFVQAGFERLP